MAEEASSHPLHERRALIALALLALPAVGVTMMFSPDYIVFGGGVGISVLGIGLTTWLYWDNLKNIRLRLDDGSVIQKPLWIGMIIILVELLAPTLVGYRNYVATPSYSLQNLSMLSDDELKTQSQILSKQLRDFQADVTLRETQLFENEMPPPMNTLPAKRIEIFRRESKRLMQRSMLDNIEYRRKLFPRAMALVAEIRGREMGTAPSPPTDAHPALVGLLAGPAPLNALADYIEDLASRLP